MEINLKFLKPKKKFTKRGARIKPHLYWRYILITSFVIILLSLLFGWLLLKEVDESSSIPAIISENQDKIEEERIKNALQYFDFKKEKSVNVLNSPSPVVDPSI